MDKADKRKACIWTTEAMIGAQEMMERAGNNRDRKIAEALFHMAMCVEFLLKAPPEEQAVVTVLAGT